MIPEKEREALMRLTMCAREECFMCGYKDRCNFDFQYDLATKNMNILADALRKTENKSEIPTGSEPQNKLDRCYKCKWWNYSYGCKCKKGVCDFEPIDEPQTEAEEVEIALELALNTCRAIHNGCKSCDLKCAWRDERSE